RQAKSQSGLILSTVRGDLVVTVSKRQLLFHFVLCHCTRKREEAQKQGVNQPSFGGGKRVSISEK
ncbi:hypothetical protein Lpp229_10815, partial [Lacticaseibacillus paracasei subsp. paracasei Lpp229]